MYSPTLKYKSTHGVRDERRIITQRMRCTSPEKLPRLTDINPIDLLQILRTSGGVRHSERANGAIHGHGCFAADAACVDVILGNL